MSGSKRISELTVTTALSGNDRVVVLTNPTSSAQTQATTLTNLANKLSSNIMPIANTTQLGVVKVGNNIGISNGNIYIKLGGGGAPAAANSAGEAGTIAYDSNYFYVCIAGNTWVRATLSTW